MDRLEENAAVLENENGEFIDVALNLLPKETRQGSVLRRENGQYLLDRDEEERRRRANFLRQERLFDYLNF